MSNDQYTHMCTLQITADSETIELHFRNEETAQALVEFLKRKPPFNLESMDLIRNVYLIEHWENDLSDYDRNLKYISESEQ